jgi:predicted metalloprotease with PDZ domain
MSVEWRASQPFRDPMKTIPIRYAIRPMNPAAHRFEVSCSVAAPDPAGQQFALPAWIPGSYLIRDFARQIVAIRAERAGRPVPLQKIDKHTWQAAPGKRRGALVVTCEIHAGDLSVRGAHLDATHGFFNGASVFLRVLGQEERACLVDIQPPKDSACSNWRLASALSPAHGEKRCAKPHSFGLYAAANYGELIDHPVEMGRFTLARFEAGGVAHEIAITGRHDCDIDRLCADLARVCAWQIEFFGAPAPMRRYTFLVTALGQGYGGLEHRASTALLCSRYDLPARGMPGLSAGYRKFLGLCSHEYFHAWHVKRIKPAAFVHYDLDRENYTTLLWAFEGFTSYYDDLALLRSGVITRAEWLEITAKTLGDVQRAPGRLRQTLAEASFDAWSKFYRPDENSPNAQVSYYAKGALLALALDLTLRARSKGRVALDDVMRGLWQQHGKTGKGVADEDIRLIAEALSGLSLQRFFADGVHGTRDLPLAKLLAPFGIGLAWEKAGTPSLGVKTVSAGEQVKLATVYDGGAAQAAGLAADDCLVAIDGLRVTPASLDQQLGRYRLGDTLAVHAFRRDELMQFSVRLAPPANATVRLVVKARANRLRKSWLGA